MTLSLPALHFRPFDWLLNHYGNKLSTPFARKLKETGLELCPTDTGIALVNRRLTYSKGKTSPPWAQAFSSFSLRQGMKRMERAWVRGWTLLRFDHKISYWWRSSTFIGVVLRGDPYRGNGTDRSTLEKGLKSVAWNRLGFLNLTWSSLDLCRRNDKIEEVVLP